MAASSQSYSSQSQGAVDVSVYPGPDEQLRELLDRLSEAVEGGSPRPVVQRVLSDLVVSLQLGRHARPMPVHGDAAVLRHLEAFELSYALGQAGGTGPLLAQLRNWWQTRAVARA